MKITTLYDIGDIVYLKTDGEQKERMITGIRITPGNHLYYLSCGDEESTHYDIEITREKDILKTFNSN